MKRRGEEAPPPAAWRFAAALAAGLAGLLLDRLRLPLLGDLALSARDFPSYLAGLAYGPGAALLAAVVSAAGSAAGGDWALVLVSAARVGLVAWFPRRQVPSLLAFLPAWALLEGPLLLGRGGFGAGGMLAALTALIGGFLNVALAELALRQGHVRFLIRPVPPFAGRRPLGSILVHSFVLLGALPPVLISGFQGRTYLARQQEESASHLRQIADLVEGRLSRQIDLHRRALAALARDLDRERDLAAARVAPRLADLREVYPGFLTLLVADERGEILAGLGRGGAVGPELRGAETVADRPYFRQPMADGKPYVSGVFVGRGFGADPIVALSVPRLGPGGERRGIVEGSLDLHHLSGLLGQEAAGDSLLVLDGLGRVVATGGSTGAHLAAPLGDGPLLRAARRGDATLELEEGSEPFGRERALAIVRAVPELGWTVVVVRPQAPFRAETERYILSTLLWILVPLGLAISIAWRLASQVTRPLSALARAQTQLALRGESIAVPEPSPSGPAEIGRLVTVYRGVSAALNESYAALGRTARERERLNRELEGLLSGLERKVQERTAELTTAKAQAERHAEAKGLFLAHMSHEIRTPLNAVIGFADLLAGSALTAEQRERLAALRASADALLAVINDILDLSKIEAGRLELDCQPIDPTDLIEDTLTLLAPRAADKRLELVSEVSPRVPRAILADGPRLRQVLLNLLGNAVRFTDRGSVEVSADCAGRRLLLAVRDTGVGIPAELQERLFAPFDQLDPARGARYGGTGLGLSIAKGLVEAMGGTLRCESQEGVGTTFSASVPVELLPAEAGPSLAAGRTLLVAVAGGSVRRTLEMRLSGWGAKVQTADSARTALEQAVEDFEALLVQVDLPDSDLLAERFRAAHPEAPLLALAPLGQPLPESWVRWSPKRLSLPLRTASLAALLADSFKADREGTAEVLVVAGQPVARKALEGRLRRAGFAVSATGDRREAEARIAAGSISLVVFDLEPGDGEPGVLAASLRALAKPDRALRFAWVGGQPGDPPPPGFDLRLPRPPSPEDLVHLRHAAFPAEASP